MGELMANLEESYSSISVSSCDQSLNNSTLRKNQINMNKVQFRSDEACYDKVVNLRDEESKDNYVV